MKKKTGFTLVELSFSVVFIAILALMVVYVSLNMSNIFERGISTKEVNTVGNSLIDDFRSAISNSSAKNLQDICEINYKYSTADSFLIKDSPSQKACEDDESYSMIYNVRMGDVVIDKSKPDQKITVPVSGAFCSGVYSYVWNSGYFFNDKYAVYDVGTSNLLEKATLKYESGDKGSTVEVNDIRLLRITDPSRQVCFSKVEEAADELGLEEISGQSRYFKNTDTEFMKNMQKNEEYDISNMEKYSKIYGEVVDLLAENKYNNLALYSFKMYRPAQSERSRNIFFAGSFILASITGGPDITAKSNYCAPPSDYNNEDFNYCSINKFNFAIQANGE